MTRYSCKSAGTLLMLLLLTLVPLLATSISGRTTSETELPTDPLLTYLSGHLLARRGCGQAEYRIWLSECWQLDSTYTIMPSDRELRATTLVRAAFNSTDACIQPPPTCYPAGPVATTPRQLLAGLRNVLDGAGCQQFFGFDSLESGRSHTGAPGDEERRMNQTQLLEMASDIADRLLHGQCVGATELARMTDDGMDRLLRADNNIYLQALFRKYAENISAGQGVTETGVGRLLRDVQLDPPSGPQPSNSSDTGSSVGGTARRQRRSVEGSEEPSLIKVMRQLLSSSRDATETLHYDKRDIGSEDNSMLNMSDCLTAPQLMTIFDNDDSRYLEESEFLELCAYVVYQVSEGRDCHQDDDQGDPFNAAKVYGYGTLCVFVISACSALGFLIIPTLSASVYDILMTSFIALAFGTLTGDALLHLFPESILGDDADSGANGVTAPDSFYKCLVIMLSIYVLYVFEGLTNLLVGHNHSEGASDQEQHGHSHTHSHDFIREQTEKAKEDKGQQQLVSSAGELELKSDWSLTQMDSQTNMVAENDETDVITPILLNQEQLPVCLGLTSLALVIIVGDAIHNVTDGISIGASFAHDIKGGLSTALAVFFHELPHEFGDFVILLTTGLTLKRALLWNFVSSLTAFVGLYVGIAVGENENAIEWIFAMTSGMFLYVAIADMLPEMRNIKSHRPYIAFLAQNIGALFGMGFMVFMYFLENFMKF